MTNKNFKFAIVVVSFMFLVFNCKNAQAQKKCQAEFDYWVHDTINGYTFLHKGTNPSGSKFVWDFGDGKTFNEYGANHHYASSGGYTVCLTRDSSGCKDTVCKSIKANKTNPCNAHFKGVADKANPLKWSFVAIDTLEESYGWMGNKKGTSYTHGFTFSSAGKQNIYLIVSNSKEHCIDTVVQQVLVKACSAGFESYVNHTNTSSFFADRSSSNITKRHWIFGDGQTISNHRNPTHVYNKPGKYWVTLIAADSISKCTDSTGMQITINDCSAKYTFGYKLTSSRTAEFIDSTKLSRYRTLWEFGDTKGSSAKKPTYTYVGADYYRVKLTIYDSTNFCTDTVSKLVLITQIGTKCKAKFDIAIYSPYPYLNYGYFSYSNSPGVIHRWTIDGVTNSNTSAGFRYNHPKSGTYTICLYINDTINKCKDSLCGTYTVGVPSKCTPSFTYSLKDSILSYSHDTLAKGTSVRWQFGDGKSSTVIKGQHTYKPGTYKMCVTLICSSTDSTEVCTTIVVKSKSCSAQYSYKIDTANNLKVKFTNLSTTSSTMNYWWDFGDGKHSSTTHPSNTYTKSGTYTVCLYLYDTSIKCTDTICQNITVAKIYCDSSFTYTISGDTVHVLYKGNASHIKWNFGNGSSSTSKSAKIIYKAGTYSACLTAYCSSGDSSKSCVSITIKSKCQALFTLALDTTKKFKLFLINKSSKTSSTQYSWSFGDSTYSGLRNPTHRYNRFGKFEICLLVIDTAVNCSSKYCDTVNLDTSGKLLKMSVWELIVIDEEVFGIKKTPKNDVKIYPNPADTKVTIFLGTSNINYNKLELVNSIGQVCIQQEISRGTESLDIELDGLSKGFYLIKLSGEQGYTFKKMIKN